MSSLPRIMDAGIANRIAGVVLKLAAAQGADRVTAMDVMKAMGISRAEMAHYCPTEDDLWRMTLTVVEQRMAATWAAIRASPAPPCEQLRSLIASQIGLIVGMPALPDMLFSRGFRQRDAALRRGLRGIRARFQTLLSMIVGEGVRCGQFRPNLDTRKTARRIIETLQGVMVSRTVDAPADDLIEGAWAHLDALLGRRAGRTSVEALQSSASCDCTRRA